MRFGGRLFYCPLGGYMDDNQLLDAAGKLLDSYRAKHPDIPGIPMPGGESKNDSPGNHYPNWKPGYWSDPAIKAGFGQKAFDSLTVPRLTGGYVAIPDRPLSLLDVIPSQELAGTDLYAFLRETVRTHAAAETAVRALKPTSSYTLTKVEDSVRTIATLSEAIPLQHLRDTRLLSEYLDGSLRQAVLLRLEEAILSGDGIAPNLEGMQTVAGTQSQAFSTNILETLRKALTLLQNIHVFNGVYVLGTADWEAIELLQEGDGTYMMHQSGAPVNTVERRLWGQRVVVSSLLAAGTALLFDPTNVRLYERETVEISSSVAPEGSVVGSTAFETNEVIFRAEGSFGFAVLKPNSIVEIDTAGP
jgi:HK97 family phage major capsid protein